MSSAPDFQRLHRLAYKLRKEALRMIFEAQSGHPASSLALADLFSLLYFAKILRHHPKRPYWDKRDYLLVSNGHISALIYASLAYAGFFEKTELKTFRKINSRLQGHPHFAPDGEDILPGIESSSGPLGQGLSQAAGLALGLKMDGKKNLVFCLMSDGEQQEGQIWEAYQFIIAKKLENLITIVDQNAIQISGNIKDVLPLGDLKLKYMSFGFRVLETNAHQLTNLWKTLEQAKEAKKPTLILLNSCPGKGVSFMENDFRWHGKAPNKSEYHQAMAELEIREKEAYEQ